MPLYLLTFLLAACSIIYELLIAKTISTFLANTVIWYSVTIGFYLAAMGMGALLCHHVLKKEKPWKALLWAEILLSAAGGFCVIIISLGQMSANYMWMNNTAASSPAFGYFLLLCWIMIISIGLLTGLELPLLIKIGGEKNISINKILSADYFGSLAGCVLFPLLLLPHLELVSIALLTGLVNLSAAIIILIANKSPQQNQKFLVNINAALFVILGFCLIQSNAIGQYFLKKYYYSPETSRNLLTLFAPMPKFNKIERYHSPYQKIDIVKVPDRVNLFWPLIKIYSTKHKKNPNYPTNYILFLNHAFQFWSNFEEMYHEYFAHVPIILNKHIPKKILVLGAGDGLLIRELVKYHEIESILNVDIDKTMLALAKTHPILSYINNHAFADPRVKTITADAYHFMKDNKDLFDAIYIDFPVPDDYDLSKLYSREFYHFVKISLNKNGFAVMDTPPLGEPNSAITYQSQSFAPLPVDIIYYNTLRAAGFKTILTFTTRLETDNPQATNFLTKKLGTMERFAVKEKSSDGTYVRRYIRKSQKITQLLESFSLAYEENMIMVKNEAQEIEWTYKDPGVDLYLLNEKRFYLANDAQGEEMVNCQLAMDNCQLIDKNKINSVMKPRLPPPSTWGEAKTPYQIISVE